MSELSDNATVSLTLADLANADAAGKLNLLGANWTWTALQPSGQTSPQALVVTIDVPSSTVSDGLTDPTCDRRNFHDRS